VASDGARAACDEHLHLIGARLALGLKFVMVREYSLTMHLATLSPSARRIAKEALRLFAEKGYERTSIADIQAAAGLAPGSGALYKHFRSKRDLLESGLAAEFATRDEAAAEFMVAVPDNPRDALTTMGRAVLDQMAREREAIRITCRDLEQFPDLLGRVREERIQGYYRLFAAWLKDQAASGRIRAHDAEAVSAVAWGALVYYRISEALIDEPPGGVGETRFLGAWVDLVCTALARDVEL
jgi:AcrR family transcriptional regulator